MKKETKAEIEARKTALAILESGYLFDRLRDALRVLGLEGEEIGLGVAIFFVTASRFLRYPLRLEIQERTKGTADYLFGRVTEILLPKSIIRLDPADEEAWKRFKEKPDRKIVYVPQWRTELPNDGYVRLDIKDDTLIRVVAVTEEDRTVERKPDEVTAPFVCISAEGFTEWARRHRWLTIRQPQSGGSVARLTISGRETETWRAMQKLLREAAAKPIVFPSWEQVVVEQACDRNPSSAERIPVLLQVWRTMCLLQSLHSARKDKAIVQANFSDLASALLLSKAVFRETSAFPSGKKIFARITSTQEDTAVRNPATGKGVPYKRKRTKLKYIDLLDNPPNTSKGRQG